VSARTFASGELKNMLDPFEPPSPAAQRKAQALVDEIGSIFVAELKARRGAKLAAGVDFASGELWTGAQAKALGLIDDIATLDTAFAELPLRQYGPARPRSIFAPEASAWLGALFESLALSVRGDRAFVLR
jgi:protease-4